MQSDAVWTDPDFQVPFISGAKYTKVKAKFTLEQVTKTQKGSRGIALLFL
jgi:hypothetical protein